MWAVGDCESIHAHVKASLALSEQIACCGSPDNQWYARSDAIPNPPNNDASIVRCSCGYKVTNSRNDDEHDVDDPPAVHVCEGYNKRGATPPNKMKVVVQYDTCWMVTWRLFDISTKAGLINAEPSCDIKPKRAIRPAI